MKYLLFAMSVAWLFVVPGSFAQDDQANEGADQTEEQRRVRRLGDVISSGDEEFSIGFDDLAIPAEPVAEVPDVRLPNAAQDARLQNILRTRAFFPDDTDNLAALNELFNEVEADIASALAAGNLQQAQRLATAIGAVEPGRPIVGEVQALVDRQNSISQTLSQAASALAAGQLVEPAGSSAAALYARVLELEPGNAQAVAGLNNTHAAVLEAAVAAARDQLDFEGAEALIEQAGQIRDDEAALATARNQVAAHRQSYISGLDDEIMALIDQGDYDGAEATFNELVAMGHSRDRLSYLQGALEDARLYGSFEPGQRFHEDLGSIGGSGPEMIVIPAGSFMMGSPDRERDRANNEGPQHRVSFERGFALSLTEVTVEQFERFIQASGYRTDAEVSGSSQIYNIETGRMEDRKGVTWHRDYSGAAAEPNLPVVHVSWRDAQAYTEWLAAETGRSYRLPSEAEFEYALRAGSTDMYWWGNKSPSDNDVENLTGDRDVSPTGARWNEAFRRYSDGYWGPGPVGTLAANPFGLYDMGGNVMEWVADCWHDSYVRAPVDGSAWLNPGCTRRVVRGGSWSSTPAMARSAFRISSLERATDTRVGFRVARDL